MDHMPGASRSTDMLAEIRIVTGYDATECANTWLRDIEIPRLAACP